MLTGSGLNTYIYKIQWYHDFLTWLANTLNEWGQALYMYHSSRWTVDSLLQLSIDTVLHLTCELVVYFGWISTILTNEQVLNFVELCGYSLCDVIVFTVRFWGIAR